MSRRRVAITGGTGFLGRPLRAALEAAGHEVRLVGRVHPGGRAPDVIWDPARGEIDRAALAGVDVVYHLAGEPIGERWTAARKAAIRQSRVDGTRLIARACADLSPRPAVLVSMSAIGIYGSRGDERLTERSQPGRDFLSEVGQVWEAAADPAREAGIRVVHPRMGIVLDASGGALAKMLTPFRLGVGGRLGDGSQWMSWISRDDAVAALVFLAMGSELSGAANVVAPAPVTNRDFTDALGRALRRPTMAVVPEFAVRLMFGEMGEATVLASQRVVPERLVQADFPFAHATLGAALAAALGGAPGVGGGETSSTGVA